MVTVDGATLPHATISQSAFELVFALPDAVVGKPEMQVTIEVPRVIRPASDPRDLGLVFGTVEVK